MPDLLKPTPAEPPFRQPSLVGMLRALWRRRFLVGVFVLLGLAATTAATTMLKPRYESEVLLLWSPPWLETQAAAGAAQAPPGVLDTNLVRGVVAILSSEQMARRVVTDMRLHMLPEFSQPAPRFGNVTAPEPSEEARIQFATGRYRRGLKITNDGRSYAISITIQSSNRALAAAMANRHAELYLEAERAAKGERLAYAREWLDGEVQRQSDRLRAAEAALRDTRDRQQPAAQRGSIEATEAVVRGLEREASAARGTYEALLARQREFAARESVPSLDARLISAAVPSLLPSGPNIPLLIVLGGICAFVLGSGLALGLEWLRPRFHDARDVQEHTGLRVMGVIPTPPGKLGIAEACLRQADTQAAEAVRSLRATLTMAPALHGLPRIVAVVGFGAGSGRSSLGLALARSLARIEERVLLIETDLRRTGPDSKAGDTDGGMQAVLSGSLRPADAWIDDVQPGLKRLVSTGQGGAPARELLGGPAMTRLLQATKGEFDWVILDTPPLGPTRDAVIVARHAQATLVVIGSGTTGRAAVREGLRALEDVGIDAQWAVLDGSPMEGLREPPSARNGMA